MNNLAIFDLDHTIINTSSYKQWITYLNHVEVIDGKKHFLILEDFYKQYTDGTINSNDFIEHQLSSLKGHARSDLIKYRQEWFRTLIVPHIKKKAVIQINRHIKGGDMVIIATATCLFIASIIANQKGWQTLDWI